MRPNNLRCILIGCNFFMWALIAALLGSWPWCAVLAASGALFAMLPIVDSQS